MNPVCFFRSFRAEFAKVFALKFPAYASLGVVVFVALVTYQLVGGEHIMERLQERNALALLPYLVWASWGKLVVIPIFLIVFATYCTAVDSQYGMVRIGCTQPLTRVDFALGKTAAIVVHAVLFVMLYLCLLILASALLGGMHFAVNAKEIGALFSFGFRLVVLNAAIAWLATGAAFFRKTLLTAFVTALLVVVGCIWLNTLPTEFGLRPYLLFRYFLYPLVPILPSGWSFEIPNADCSIWQFAAAALGMPAILWSASIAYFVKRDITE